MKILVFNWRDLTHPWAGGAEVFLHEVARRWARQAHDVTWFSGRFPGQPATETIEGVSFIRCGGPYSVYLRAAWHYLAHLRGGFDAILDSANGIPFFTPLYSETPKVLLVHHIHQEVFFRELPPYQARLANILEHSVMPRLYQKTHCATVSESSRRSLMALGVPPEHISVIYNGVDHACYVPGAKSQTPLILFVGRLRNYKSVDVAIRALPGILQAAPNARLSIVGSGEAEGSLRCLADALGLAQSVRFHGHLPQNECIRLLQAAHVVVNPSMKEGWGLTVIEANACGTPVVAADVPGLCNSVVHGVTGWLVPYGDPVALGQRVSNVLLDAAERERLARNASAWAACFDWDRTAGECLRILCCQIEGKKP